MRYIARAHPLMQAAQNILIDAEGVAKITDFGLGKLVHRALERRALAKSFFTNTGRASRRRSRLSPGDDASFSNSKGSGSYSGQGLPGRSGSELSERSFRSSSKWSLDNSRNKLTRIFSQSWMERYPTRRMVTGFRILLRWGAPTSCLQIVCGSLPLAQGRARISLA
eukprot:jgi/Mesvir1/21256/Mv21660-RA.1